MTMTHMRIVVWDIVGQDWQEFHDGELGLGEMVIIKPVQHDKERSVQWIAQLSVGAAVQLLKNVVKLPPYIIPSIREEIKEIRGALANKHIPKLSDVRELIQGTFDCRKTDEELPFALWNNGGKVFLINMQEIDATDWD